MSLSTTPLAARLTSSRSRGPSRFPLASCMKGGMPYRCLNDTMGSLAEHRMVTTGRDSHARVMRKTPSGLATSSHSHTSPPALNKPLSPGEPSVLR
eukprot:scaffold22045_cov111-Isochrysis_galbana.AAC.3